MPRTQSRLWLAVALGILSASCSQDVSSPNHPSISADNEGRDDDQVTYAVIGDVPYGTTAKTNFPSLIDAINADPAVTRVIHVGDIKASNTTCDNGWFGDIATLFGSFTDPLVYAIGDNEWTDCHRLDNGGYNPLERLAKIRELFFANPGYTLGGQQVPLKVQDGYPENQQWMASDVVVSVFHIIGSNNGRDRWFATRVSPKGETPEETAAREAEWAARDAADLRWLEGTFDEAKEEHARGVLLFFQADMWNPVDRAPPNPRNFDAFAGFVQRLAELAPRFKRPVLLVVGDSHDYRVDVGVPWFSLFGATPPENVTQVVVDRSIESAPDVDGSPKNYVRLTVDPKSKGVFSWEQVTVP